MAHYNIPVINTTGLDNAFISVGESVPIFIHFLLLSIFFIIFVIGYRKQREESGNNSPWLWGTVAGVVTSIVALILATKMTMSIAILITPIVTTIIAAILLFTSEDRI